MRNSGEASGLTPEQRYRATARILATGAMRVADEIDSIKRKIDKDEDTRADFLGSRSREGAENTG